MKIASQMIFSINSKIIVGMSFETFSISKRILIGLKHTKLGWFLDLVPIKMGENAGQVFHIWVSGQTHSLHKKEVFRKDFYTKCKWIRRKLRICLHLAKNFIFCTVLYRKFSITPQPEMELTEKLDHSFNSTKEIRLSQKYESVAIMLNCNVVWIFFVLRQVPAEYDIIH